MVFSYIYFTGMVVIIGRKYACYPLLMGCLIDTFSNYMYITGHKIFISFQQCIHIYNTRRRVGNTKQIAYIIVNRTVAFTWIYM
jgi:hypothetical protein